MGKIIIFHNIISPYKVLMFNELNKYTDKRLHVVFFAETADDREWRIEYGLIEFDYTVLNHGSLNQVGNMKLSKQIAKFLLDYPYKISVVLLGEYIKPAYWCALLWGLIHRKTIGAILESQQADHKRVWLKEFIKRIFFFMCDFVIAAGQKHKDYAVSLGMAENNVAVIGGVGGVNHSLYDKCIMQWENHGRLKSYLTDLCGLPANKCFFIYVGRFSQEKNLLRLLDAFAKLNDAAPDWGLLMLGGGIQESVLKEKIQEKCIQNVYFSGFVQQDNLPYYYLLSDVFVLPSLSETWGLVVDEAVYLGKPVIVSEQCGCVPDIVKADVNGWVIDPLSVDSLYKAMLEATLDDARLERYAKASKAIGKQHSPQNSAYIIWDMMLSKGFC